MPAFPFQPRTTYFVEDSPKKNRRSISLPTPPAAASAAATRTKKRHKHHGDEKDYPSTAMLGARWGFTYYQPVRTPERGTRRRQHQRRPSHGSSHARHERQTPPSHDETTLFSQTIAATTTTTPAAAFSDKQDDGCCWTDFDAASSPFGSTFNKERASSFSSSSPFDKVQQSHPSREGDDAARKRLVVTDDDNAGAPSCHARQRPRMVSPTTTTTTPPTSKQQPSSSIGATKTASQRVSSVLDRPFAYWQDLNILFQESFPEWTSLQRGRMIHHLVHFLELKIGIDEYVPTGLLLPTPIVEQAWKTLVLETMLYTQIIHELQDYHEKTRAMIHYSFRENRQTSPREKAEKIRRTQSLFWVYFKEPMPATLPPDPASSSASSSSSSPNTTATSKNNQEQLKKKTPPTTRLTIHSFFGSPLHEQQRADDEASFAGSPKPRPHDPSPTTATTTARRTPPSKILYLSESASSTATSTTWMEDDEEDEYNEAPSDEELDHSGLLLGLSMMEI